MVRRVAATLLVVAAGVGASELRDRLDAALRLEDPRAAAAGLRRALEAAPSGDHVAESIAPAHWRVIDALASSPRTIDVAKRLVRLAYPRDCCDAPVALRQECRTPSIANHVGPRTCARRAG
jgi:hypothetical protein